MAYRDGHESKRARYDGGDTDVADRLTSLVRRLGEQSKSSLRDNLQGLAQVLERDLDKFKAEIVSTVVECGTDIPEKLGVYSTLVGLLNAKNYDVGEEIVISIATGLQNALDEGAHSKCKALLRFIADLVNANVLLPTSLIALYDSFLAVIEEEDVPQARKDFYVGLVMHSLPWIGSALFERDTNLERICSTIETYMDTRDSTYRALRVFISDDPLPQPCLLLRPLLNRAEQNEELATLWAQISKLQERKWSESVIFRPYTSFDDVLEQALQHTLPPSIEVRPHTPKTSYPIPRVVFRMFDEMDTPEEPIMPPLLSIERQIVETTIVDITDAYSDSHHQCVKHINEFANNYANLPMDHIIIEAWFSQVFRLPKPSKCLLYYFMVLSELVRSRESVSSVLALAMDILFAKLGDMEVECQTRFAEFCGYFITYFDFKFRWEDWFEATTAAPTHPMAVFVREALVRTMRLSFYDRVRRSVPAELTPLLPVEPTYLYMYADIDAAQLQALCIEGIIGALQRKDSAKDVLELLDQIQPEAAGQMDVAEEGLRILKIRVLMSTALYVGSKSLTHMIFIIERFHGVFTALATTSEEKLRLVQCVVQFWANNPQMVSLLLSRLLAYNIVDTTALVHWVFDEHTLDLFPRHHLWEVLFDALDFVVEKASMLDNKVRSAQTKIQEVPDGEDVPETYTKDLERLTDGLEAAEQTQKAAFLVTFQHFAKVLSEFLAKCDKDEIDHATHWYRVASQRLIQAARRYCTTLRGGIFESIHQLVFEDVDPRIKGLVDEFNKVLV